MLKSSFSWKKVLPSILNDMHYSMKHYVSIFFVYFLDLSMNFSVYICINIPI